MPNLEKNAKIREKRNQTLIRRKSQGASVLGLKPFSKFDVMTGAALCVLVLDCVATRRG